MVLEEEIKLKELAKRKAKRIPILTKRQLKKANYICMLFYDFGIKTKPNKHKIVSFVKEMPSNYAMLLFALKHNI